MTRKKLLVIPILLLLIVAASMTQASKPYKYTPIPSELFTPLIVTPLAPSATPTITVYKDFRFDRPPKPKPVAQPPKPKPKAIVKPKPKPTPKPRVIVVGGRYSIGGIATWYCNYDDGDFPHSVCHHSYPDRSGFADLYAAAGPAIRIGNWRGRVVTVYATNGRHVTVKLVDWCACGGGHSIDLYRDAMDVLGLRWGGSVKVRW